MAALTNAKAAKVADATAYITAWLLSPQAKLHSRAFRMDAFAILAECEVNKRRRDLAAAKRAAEKAAKAPSTFLHDALIEAHRCRRAIISHNQHKEPTHAAA